MKENIAKIYVLVYRKPNYTDQYLHCSSPHQARCKESVVSSLFNRVYSIITNKDDLNRINTKIKQLLKKIGYHESIISKIRKRITNNYSLSQSQQQTQVMDIQEYEIRISVNLSYVEGICEKLQCILISPKIRSNFYSENTNRKIEQLQKIKTTSLVKLTVVSAKQCTSVNLNGL